MRRRLARLTALATAAVLAACGTNDSPPPPPTTPSTSPSAVVLTDVRVGAVSMKEVLEQSKKEVGGDFDIVFVPEGDAAPCGADSIQGTGTRPRYCKNEHAILVPAGMGTGTQATMLTPVVAWYLGAREAAISMGWPSYPTWIEQHCAGGFLATMKTPNFHAIDDVRDLKLFVLNEFGEASWVHVERGIDARIIDNHHQTDLAC